MLFRIDILKRLFLKFFDYTINKPLNLSYKFLNSPIYNCMKIIQRLTIDVNVI